MKNNSPAISPFKFLDSYTRGDKDIFFGRQKEVSEIHAKIYQSKLLLVYGASGTGKSSIINCGLANQLADTDWLPVHVRRGGDITESMLNQLQKETAAEIELNEDGSKESLHKNLHKVVSNVYLDHFKPIYLIFDQFEELFIFGYKEEWLNFIHAIRYLMDTDLDVHFMFVIRGEYLEFLSEFEEIIPEFFDNRVRIEKMTRSMARESISGPSKLCAINLDENFEDNLLKKLSPDKSHIELTFLQVVLDKIYRNAIARSGDSESLSFTNDDIEAVGQLGDILAEFVDEQLFKMPDTKAALTVLKGFVSLEGTKTQKSIDDIVRYCANIGQNLNPEEVEGIITSFVNKRILKEKDDNERYELRHDSLAQKIFEKITNQEKELLEVRRFIDYNFDEYRKRQSILSDDDLSYIAPFERLLKLDGEQEEFLALSKKKSSRRRRAQRRRSIVIALISLLLLTSIVGFVISQQQRQRAERLAKLAETESAKARNAQVAAEEQRALAAQNAREAAEQALLAERQAAQALTARDLARQQELEANRQKAIAENQKSQAELARQMALRNEQEAMMQKAIAENRQVEADKLRMLALSREIALKAIYMVDKERKALLSKVAYDLNNEFAGDTFAPNIYRSLYLAKKAVNGDDFNSLSLPGKEIIGLLQHDRKQLIATSDGEIYKINAQETPMTATNILKSGLRISCFDLLEDIGEIAVGSRDGKLIFIKLNGEVVLRTQLENQSAVIKTVLHTNKRLIVQQNGQISEFDEQGILTAQTNLGARINDLIRFTDKLIFAAFEDGTLVQLDGDLKIVKRDSLPGNAAIEQLQKLNETDLIVANSNGEIFRYDINKAEIEANLIGHTASITDMYLAGSGNYLITSSFDRSVRLWNLSNFRSQSILLSEHERWATAVSIDQDEQYAFSTSYSGKLRKYPLEPAELADGLCDAVDRALSADEWSEFIGDAVPYKVICQ